MLILCNKRWTLPGEANVTSSVRTLRKKMAQTNWRVGRSSVKVTFVYVIMLKYEAYW